MPIIDVTLLEGRSPQVKAALIRQLTEAAHQALGAPRESIRVLLRELPAENWGVGGESKAGPPK